MWNSYGWIVVAVNISYCYTSFRKCDELHNPRIEEIFCAFLSSSPSSFLCPHFLSLSTFKCFPPQQQRTFLKAQEKWNTRQCRLQHLLCSAINHWLSPLASKINLFPNLLFLFFLIFLAILLRFIFLLPILAISNYSSTPWTLQRLEVDVAAASIYFLARMKWWNMEEVFPFAWINFL